MAEILARCEGCGLVYQMTDHDEPATVKAYTCDDCGGYVDEDVSWWEDLTEDERDRLRELATGGY